MRLPNPFRKYDLTDFSGVVVPLTAATRYQNVVDLGQRASLASASNDATVECAEVKLTRGASNNSAITMESLRAEVNASVAASGHDTVYDRKAKVINLAIDDIGMTRYQWRLFALCGFGWLADNLWLQGVALTLPSLQHEFGISETQVRYTTLAMFAGLCLGAVCWGVLSDIVGRRLAFNMTLLITSVFGTAVGFANSWIQVCALYAVMVGYFSRIRVLVETDSF